MAKNNPNIGMPVDQPIQTSPGIMYREASIFAQVGDTYDTRGFVRAQILPGSPVSAQNRNQAGTAAAVPAWCKEPTPFSNLRKR